MYKLANLSFTHSYDSNENIVNTNMFFQPWKLKVSGSETKENSWNVFYDDKILILKLKAFSGEICRSKTFARENYVKIEDPCLKKLYREICHEIYHMIRIKEYYEKKECHEWSRECSKVFLTYFDHRLSLRKTHYFEDVSIVFEGAELVKDEGKHPRLRLKNEMIKAKSMSV